MRLLRFLLAALALALLPAACGGGGGHAGFLPERVWPPQATLAELRIGEDGTWQITLRLQNFSTVAMRFDRVEVSLSVEEQPAGSLARTESIDLGPSLAEPLQFRVRPDAGAAAALQAALRSGRGLHYELKGQAQSSEPHGRWPLDYKGVLTPVAGLKGVLR